uniref:Non-selective voltage-gated ion channel VDAC3 n=1 Tax=Seriola lalandi dorsalis TaxID=1841481 RepID=A0A3B4WBB6_SERLL
PADGLYKLGEFIFRKQLITVVYIKQTASDGGLIRMYQTLDSHRIKSGKLKTGYKRDFVNLGCDVDFEGPIIHAAAVLGYEGWLAGYQMAFDTAKSKLAQNNFALGYRAGDFQLHTNVNDGTEFGGSIYQKVNDELETAVTLAWTAGSNNTRFGIAAKYKLDKDASLHILANTFCCCISSSLVSP